MNESIHRPLTVVGGRGFKDTDALGTIIGGEFSALAMNRSRQKFIEILDTWQKAKDKKEERKLKDQEKDQLVNIFTHL